MPASSAGVDLSAFASSAGASDAEAPPRPLGLPPGALAEDPPRESPPPLPPGAFADEPPRVSAPDLALPEAGVSAGFSAELSGLACCAGAASVDGASALSADLSAVAGPLLVFEAATAPAAAAAAPPPSTSLLADPPPGALALEAPPRVIFPLAAVPAGFSGAVLSAAAGSSGAVVSAAAAPCGSGVAFPAVPDTGSGVSVGADSAVFWGASPDRVRVRAGQPVVRARGPPAYWGRICRLMCCTLSLRSDSTGRHSRRQ